LRKSWQQRQSDSEQNSTFEPHTYLCSQFHAHFVDQAQVNINHKSSKDSASTLIFKMSERYIPEHRRTQFKAKGQFKPDELRRRREEQQVEIRKAKREENLAKRRGITGRDGTQQSAPGASLGAAPDSDDDEEGGPIEAQVSSRTVPATDPHAAKL
jgi:hypothetical protein